MTVGIVIAIGFGLIVVGGCGTMATSTEIYPNKGLVTMFILLFLVGMAMVGGGLGVIA